MTADATKLNLNLSDATHDYIAVNHWRNWTIDEIRIGDSDAAVSGTPHPGVAALMSTGFGLFSARRGRSQRT